MKPVIITLLASILIAVLRSEDDTNKPPRLESVEAAKTNTPPPRIPVYILPTLEVCYTTAGPIARVPDEIDWKRLTAIFPTRTLSNVVFLKP